MTNFTDAELRDRIAKQIRQRKCRDGYQQFLAEQRPHAFITLTINRGARRLESMKENLAKWAYYCDGRLNNKSRRISKLPPDRRLQGCFVPEKQDTNAHWHGLIKFPEASLSNKVKAMQLPSLINHCWRGLVGSGNGILTSIFEAEGAAGYCLKEHYTGTDFYGSLTELSDFWPVSKPGRIR